MSWSASSGAVRVLLLDRPDRGRRGEQRLDPVLGDHPPERARVGRADRLALVEHRGRADDQRRVDDVGVADDPADVGGSPPDVAGRGVVDRSAATRPSPRRGRRCRARCPWACRWCRRCRGRRAGRSRPPRRTAAGSVRPALHRQVPVDVAPFDHRASTCGRCLTTTAAGGCSASSSAWSTSGLYSTTRPGSSPQDAVTTHLGPGVVDADGELVGGEAAEHHRVHGADARAGQHRDHGLGDHRHVDDDPVALGDAESRAARRRTPPPRSSSSA